jgi:RNA polymerase sigma-70 factor (ECF subfamily)
MQQVNRVSRFTTREPEGTGKSSAVVAEFELLFAECESDVKAFVYTLLPHWPDADDVVQRTRIVLWQKFGQFRTGTSFKAWALQVARFEVNNFRRTQRSDRHCFEDRLIDSLAEVRNSMTEELDRRRTVLATCMEKLRPSDRQIIRQCYGPNATTAKEAAERLQRPVNTLYKALNRIRRTLMDCVARFLGEEGQELT